LQYEFLQQTSVANRTLKTKEANLSDMTNFERVCLKFKRIRSSIS